MPYHASTKHEYLRYFMVSKNQTVTTVISKSCLNLTISIKKDKKAVRKRFEY